MMPSRPEARGLKTARRLLAAVFALGLAAAAAPAAPAAVLWHDDFSAGLGQWVVEQLPGGTVATKDGALVINDANGCTVWFRPRLAAPVAIRYEITVVSAGGPHDRVSDVNCFWMAQDLHTPDDLFAPGRGRNGKLSTYDPLRTYYVGFGGNANTTTRFRRYPGDGSRPLLSNYDLSAPRVLLTANHTYQISVVARDGHAEFWRDGERIFDFPDPAPLASGWFGFRTVRSHLVIRHFVVERPGS